MSGKKPPAHGGTPTAQPQRKNTPHPSPIHTPRVSSSRFPQKQRSFHTLDNIAEQGNENGKGKGNENGKGKGNGKGNGNENGKGNGNGKNEPFSGTSQKVGGSASRSQSATPGNAARNAAIRRVSEGQGQPQPQPQPEEDELPLNEEAKIIKQTWTRRNSHGGGGPERFSSSSNEAKRRIAMVTSEEHNRQLKEKNKHITELVERSANLRTELNDAQRTIKKLSKKKLSLGGNTKKSKSIQAKIKIQDRKIKRMQTLGLSYAEQLNKMKKERNMLVSQKPGVNAIVQATKSRTTVSAGVQATNSIARVNRSVQVTPKTSKKPKTSVKTVTAKNIQKIKQETNAGVPTTPPGFTKTNIERLLQPFKQPVTVKFAPTISVKGGSAKATGGSLQQTQIQYKTKAKTPANKKKKPLKFTRGPATARKQESAKFRNAIISKLRSPVAAKRREALYSLRTPTTGQRKKHVIELIDRVLRRMKVRADVEKKLIKFYESLSERHIKQLFGGRTKEDVKTILKKQVSYFSKKR